MKTDPVFGSIFQGSSLRDIAQITAKRGYSYLRILTLKPTPALNTGKNRTKTGNLLGKICRDYTKLDFLDFLDLDWRPIPRFLAQTRKPFPGSSNSHPCHPWSIGVQPRRKCPSGRTRTNPDKIRTTSHISRNTNNLEPGQKVILCPETRNPKFKIHNPKFIKGWTERARQIHSLPIHYEN
jgi:hypothetical protein